MTYQKLFISRKSNSHLIILMKVFIRGGLGKKKKTFNDHEKWSVASCIRVVVAAVCVEKEYILYHRREFACLFSW